MTRAIATLCREIEAEKAASERPRFAPMLQRIDTEMPDHVTEHPAGAYLISTQTRMSRTTAFSALKTVARLLGENDIKSTPWHLIRYHQMNVVRSILAEHYAPATANKMLSIVRGVLRQAWKLGMMTTDDYRRAASVPAIPGSRLPTGRALDAGEIRALFEACAQTGPRAARDAALLATLLGCGLRRSEAANLNLEHLDTTEATLRVAGKGNHERIAHMNGGVESAVTAWVKARGQAPGPLLCGINKSGRITLHRLPTESIRLILKQRAAEARIRECTPHDLRRTFISSLLDEGNDIAIASRMAGHRNVSTTIRYDRRDERANKDAAATIHIPYQAPPHREHDANTA